MLAIRSSIFNIVFISWTIILLSTLWLLMPFSRKIFRQAVALWPRLTFPLMRYILGLTFEQRGLENIPDEAVIFAAKHQSTWDTMYFLWLNYDNAYVMKGELNRIPFWKWYMNKCFLKYRTYSGNPNHNKNGFLALSTISMQQCYIVSFQEMHKN